MKNKACAFCGSVDKGNPRTKGHVLQRSMYPETGCESVERITVPECAACKAIWQDAEAEFRSFVALPAAHLNEHADAQWEGPIRRAHEREQDGVQRMGSILRRVATVETPDGAEYRLFPHLSEKVLLVVRKIVRGLCHHHGLATQIADHQVLTGLFPNSPPAGASPVVFDYLPGVFRYSYFHLHQKPKSLHVHWLLTFYESVSFLGMVSTKRNLEWEAKHSKKRRGDVGGAH